MTQQKARPLALRTLGILGGASDKATVEYYRRLNEGINKRFGGWDIAETIIVGMNFGNIEHYIRTDDWEDCRAYVEDKTDRLVAAGADAVMCASNTLHRVLEPVMAERSVPFLHIADAAGKAIRNAGLSRVSLFGTKPVMASDYPRRIYEERYGLEILVPDERERDDIDRIIFEELCRDRVEPASKARYLEIADRLTAQGSQGLIMGCTEIFLLLEQGDRPDHPMFNTTELHVAAGIAFALGEEGP